MPDTSPTNSKIVAAYRERTPGSERLAAEAQTLLPSGIAHDARYLKPYGIYVDHAKGPRKWDVDGNEYVDYFGGHGSLILGHNHPTVIAAAHAALEQGTHFGSNHAREVKWAGLVRRLVPSAESVRFTSSGTEATLMGVRLARAFTGKPKFVRFLTHFHGWHDHMTSGHTNHFDGTPTTGVLTGIAEHVILLPPGDEAAVRETFASRSDIACVILEPTGTSFGAAPIAPSFLTFLREETRKHGILLIFDEVITGFRVSPGGAQAQFGVKPDLTAVAKILAGGLPGGAICGRRDILDDLDFDAAERKQREKIAHPGTYNANPLSAASGIAALEIVGSTDACARANSTAAQLRAALNDVLAQERAPWAVHGTFSGFHLFLNPKRRSFDPRRFETAGIDYTEMLATQPALTRKLRLALLANGVDVNNRIGGFTSATHGKAEIEDTARALRESIRMLRAEGEMPSA